MCGTASRNLNYSTTFRCATKYLGQSRNDHAEVPVIVRFLHSQARMQLIAFVCCYVQPYKAHPWNVRISIRVSHGATSIAIQFLDDDWLAFRARTCANEPIAIKKLDPYRIARVRSNLHRDICMHAQKKAGERKGLSCLHNTSASHPASSVLVVKYLTRRHAT